MASKSEVKLAYKWVAYMSTHESAEISRLIKFGTPSDKLIQLANQTTPIAGKSIVFPLSLSKRSGQQLLFDVAVRFNLHLKTIPAKAYELLQHVKATVRHRRSDTQRNLHMVAEAILHRAACEFKTEVIFAFDSINVWVKSVYGKELGYQTLHKALEILEEAGIIRVNEWGKRGVRARATKIEILSITRKPILTYTSDIDDWLLYNDHAMTAVYRRESVARQDVLEAAIHHYAEQLVVLEDEFIKASEHWRKPGLFGFNSAKMESVEVVGTEKDQVSDDYFNRLLGGLVCSVQEDVSLAGQASSGVRRPFGTSQGERRQRE
jgi:hypothetical protein